MQPASCLRRPLDALTVRAEAPGGYSVRSLQPAETAQVPGCSLSHGHLDRLGPRPSTPRSRASLELRSEIQELKGDVKKTVKLFQTEPLCAIQDSEGAIHEVKAAYREEIQSNAVEVWPLALGTASGRHQPGPQPGAVIRWTLRRGGPARCQRDSLIFETQPLDAIREILVDEQGLGHPSTLSLLVQMFSSSGVCLRPETDTLRGKRKTEQRSHPKRQWSPGTIRSTLWLFETKPLTPETMSKWVTCSGWVPRRARGSQMSVYPMLTSSAPTLQGAP